MSDDHVTLKSADGETFYFPAVSVSRVLAKNNQVISLPGRTKGYDRLQFTDRFRLIGNWHDYPEGKYDGRTAFARMIAFMRIITEDRRKMVFTWYSKNQFAGAMEVDGPHQVMVGAVNLDKNSGEGKIMSYVIELDRITD